MTDASANAARAAPAGHRINPSDSRYTTMVRGFNPRWVGSPRYVVLCGDTAQVVDAVQRAVGEGLRITVRGGGHCYENFACGNDGGVIVDVSLMHGVYEAEEGMYCVEAGATLWNVYSELYRRFRVTLPGGSCYSVGVGGHVTGGGYGLLSRKHGLIVDYLYEVEVVCVDADGHARSVRVNRDCVDPDERDLLWAHLGGGGGNFGVVTRFWFRDPPPAPNEARLVSMAWNWRELSRGTFGELVDTFGRFFAENSAVDSPYAGLFALLHLSQNAGADSQIVLTAQYVGDEPSLLDEFTRTIADALPEPTAQRAPVGHQRPPAAGAKAQALSWLWATMQLDGGTPNQRGKYKSAYMLKPFPERQVDVMWRYLGETQTDPNPRSLLQVDSYGCRVNALAPDATAIPQRSSIMKLQFQAYWTTPDEDGQNLAWIREFYEEMYGPHGPVSDSVMDGCYVNYPDVDLANWQQLYYKDGYSRLQAVKQRWDPGDVFNHLQSIELPGN
jgi:FAD/FMN-containing dehydrogenase